MFIAERAQALLSVALVPMFAVALLSGTAASASGATPTVSSPPSATAFAAELAGAANHVAAAAGDSGRLSGTHCVEPAAGAYMCAYTITNNGISTCHLMQGRWTPNKASKITVTLAGRTGRCGTLEEAIQTLH